MKGTTTKSRRLTIAIIVEEALALLDEVGLEGLSTRALAARLGVAGPSLYWHVKNKQTLFSHMAEAMFMAHLPKASSEELSWQDWLKAGAHCIRDAALSRRDGARVIATSHPTGTIDALSFPAMIKRLVDAGLTQEQSLNAMLVMSRFTLGWVLAEQLNGHTGIGDSKQAYTFGLDTIVRGLEAITG